VLLAQNGEFLAGERTLANIRRLIDPGAVVVIGGQQAGLFGGPLYTLYKALTVLALAERLESELGSPVIPVFWIASEDHDLAEVNHTYITDAEGRLVEVSCGGEDGRKLPVSLRRLGEGLTEAMSVLSTALPDSEFAPDVSSALRQAYVSGSAYPRAFASWMRFLLQDRGIVLVDPSDVRLKRLASDLFRREIMEKGPIARAVRRHTARMAELGYEAQIELREGMLTLFHQDPEREAIVTRDDGFAVKDGSRRFSERELITLLDSAPEKLSPNAALRPLYQDSIFPTAAVVLGPSELVYYTQLTEAYTEMGIEMPILLPRASITLMEPKIAKLMDRHGLGLEDVLVRGEHIVDELARREVPSALFDRLAEGKAGVESIWRGLLDGVERLDPTLRPTAENAMGTGLKQFELLERKLIQAAKKRDETLRTHADKIIASLFPRKGLQERSLNILPFLLRYGMDLIGEIYARIDPLAAEHREVRIRG
jgi:bacillithiol biosynthesis cysteine-adding enzyme BshC